MEEEKRYCVFVENRLRGLFATLDEAQKLIESRWWDDIVTIWDLKQQEVVTTVIRI